MKYFVYAIESREGYRYTRTTENLSHRLSQHNNHNLSFWTKRGSDWKIIFQEEFENKRDALKKEKWLKSGVGREYLRSTIQSNNHK
jgi:putative endonuclease